MTDHAKRQEHLDALNVTRWTKYASVSFGALFVMGSLILMMV